MPYGSVGGMERLALNFYNHYRGEGFEVKALKLIKLESDIINFGTDEIALSTIDFCEMSFLRRLFFYIKAPFLIRKVIKENKITHSISFGDMTNLFVSLTFTDEYKVASIHALKSVEFVNQNFLNKLYKIAYKSSYRFFDKVVCISEAIKKDLIANCGFKFEKLLKVIYNPHDINNIKYLATIPIENEYEKKIFENDVVLFLGRLSNQKSPWHLIKAFSLISESDPNLKLVFIGDGVKEVEDYMLRLIVKFSLNEKVILLGRKSNPYQYLKLAKVLALTSNFEGTPNVIVESIACGVPVVSSNCTDGIEELMCVNKMKRNDNIYETESGFITPSFFKGSLAIPNNDEITSEEKDFANALQLVLSDDRYKQILFSNRNELLSKFDINIVTKSYLD
jgi:glycosyltransferase involved in cell wall biosynthesis